MAKVFVSYSRKDIEFARRLTGELQKSDLDFWIDWEGIPPTVDWWKEIEKGIEEADVFLFLISPDSAKSKICGQEIDAAAQNGKRIIPIVVREIDWQDTPPQLGHLNYIFFSRDDDFDTAIKKLMTAIQTDYEWAATHRRLQVKALDWERNGKDPGFLLRGKDLQDAEFQLATNTSKEPHPTDLQREYVFESRKATDRQRRITTGISIAVAIILAGLAVFGIVMAIRATNAQAKAEAETRRATAGKLALESKSALEKFPQRSLLLALEAVRTNEAFGEPVLPEAEEALRFAVERVPGIRLDGFKSDVTFTQFVSDPKTGVWLVAGSAFFDTDVQIWDFDKFLNDPAYVPFNIGVPGDPTGESTIFPMIDKSPQNTWLVTNATDGYSLWRIADADEKRTPVSFETQPTFIDPKDDTLILEQQTEQAVLWRVDPDSLKKQEVGRLAGQYSDYSPQKTWVVIKTGDGDHLWPIAGSETNRPSIEFKGTVIFADAKNDRRVVEQLSGQAILWEVDPTALQKKEVRRFEGTYAASSPDFKYMVTKDPNKNLVLWETKSFYNPRTLVMQNDFSDVVIDPRNHWLIVFEAITHPDILVTPVDMFGNPQETQAWASTTLSIFLLNNLDQPPFRFQLDERGLPGRFSPNGNTMLLTAHGMPDEYGNELSKLGVIKLEGEIPVVQIASQGYYANVPQFINEDWLIDLNVSELFDLRDDDMEPDATYDSSLDFSWYGDNSDFKLVFAENGKYLVAGRERINLEVLEETRTLVREPNPDASLAQTDITNLLKFNPLTLGVEGDVTASATSPDGNWLVAGTSDGSLRLWNYKRPWASSIHLDSLPQRTYIALSNDNQWLAIGRTLWKLKDGKPTTAYQFETQNDDADAGVFSPDSHWFIQLQRVFKAEADPLQVNVSLIDMTQDMSVTTLQSTRISQPGKIYNTVQFSPNSKWVIIGGNDAGFIFNLEDKSSYILPSHMDAVFTPDQNHIILIPPSIHNEADNTTTYLSPEIWSVPKSSSGAVEKIGTLDSHGFSIISRNGRWLLTVPGGSNFSDYGTFLAADSKLWDVNCIIEEYACKPFIISTGLASFSPDSRYLMLGWKETDDYDQPVIYEIWDMQPWEKDQNAQPVRIESRNSPTFDPTIGKTGNLVVLQKNESCDYSGRLSSTAVLSSSWAKHPWLANLSTFDGYAYLELGGGGGGAGGEPGYHVDYRVEALLRDGPGYQSISLRGHESSITANQISPNERYVLTYSSGTDKDCRQRENILRLWDMDKMRQYPQTQAVTLPLKLDAQTFIAYLAFSPDSKWVYVMDGNNILYYFPTSIETLKEKACQVAGRNFIINEWERFFPGEDYRKTCDNLPEHPSVNLETTPGP